MTVSSVTDWDGEVILVIQIKTALLVVVGVMVVVVLDCLLLVAVLMM